MTCSSAAVEPTSDSALPIRAELFGGPGREEGQNDLQLLQLGLLPIPRSPFERSSLGAPRGTALGLRSLHSSEALWGPREGRHLASALPIRAKLFGGPEREDGDIISCQ